MLDRAIAVPRFSLVAAIVSVTICLGLLLPASVVEADSNESSTQSVNQTVIEAPGTATGNASAGTATASAEPLIIQRNIQVLAGQANESNTTQNATNDVTLNQTSIAGSGDAAGTTGGVANSGAAGATSRAVVLQFNLQIIAGYVPEGGVTQNAANIAEIDQTTAGLSGSANADGTGSQATSGAANASSSTFLTQGNIQIYIGTRHGAFVFGPQDALNFAQIDQTTVAASGNANASSGGNSTSGEAGASNTTRISQSNFPFFGGLQDFSWD